MRAINKYRLYEPIPCLLLRNQSLIHPSIHFKTWQIVRKNGRVKKLE